MPNVAGFEMYKLKYTLYSLMLLAAIILASCHHKPTMSEMGVTLDTLKVKYSAQLVPDSVGSPCCSVNLSIITFTNPDHSSLNDSILRSGILSPEYLSLTSAHISPKAAVDSFVKRYTSDYRDYYTGIYTDEADSSVVTIGYTLDTEIMEGFDSVLVYKAHITNRQGDISTAYSRYANIDINHKRILHLEDIFVHGYEKALSEAIVTQLMKQSANKSIGQLNEAGFFVNTVPYATENFILGDNSITFVYVAGEIADRDKGEIQVELKYTTVKNLLKR